MMTKIIVGALVTAILCKTSAMHKNEFHAERYSGFSNGDKESTENSLTDV